MWLLAGLVAAAGIAVGIDRAFFPGGAPSRPALQQILDRLVQSGVAPGVTAYAVGPQGTWSGSAGIADVKTSAPMRPDARMRIESNSKTWLGAPTGTTGCGPAYLGEGAGDGYHGYAVYDTTGNHIAVLLLNQGQLNAAAAARALYCGA